MTEDFDDGDLRARSAALRAEWRDEEEEWTRAAFEHWEHGHTLVDIARDCMHRGDTVTFTTPHVVIRGVIDAVGLDTVLVVDDDRVTDVHLVESGAIVLRVVRRARAGGTRGSAASSTFRARLLEHESMPTVELGTFTLPDTLRGELRVGADHVRVRSHDAAESFVPTSSVAWVRVSRL